MIYETVFYMSAGAIFKANLIHWGPYQPIIPVIDNNIPFVPYFFIEVYCLSYAFWVFAPMVIAAHDKKNFLNFMIYSTFAFVIGFLLLIFVPTTFNRADAQLWEKIQDIKGPLTRGLCILIYNGDGKELAYNMCPSFHVLSCVLLSLGVFRQKDCHPATRYSNYAITLLITISTMFVKQHYFADVIAGIILPIICYIPVMLWNPGRRILEHKPNFLIIEKLNWTHEKITRKVGN